MEEIITQQEQTKKEEETFPCAVCKISSMLKCCENVYYCSYVHQLNDKKHYSVCKRKEALINIDDHLVANSVYRFFVKNVTKVIDALRKYCFAEDNDNNKQKKPYVCVGYEEDILDFGVLSYDFDIKELFIGSMADNVEMAGFFEKEGVNFYENILFHFKSRERVDVNANVDVSSNVNVNTNVNNNVNTNNNPKIIRSFFFIYPFKRLHGHCYNDNTPVINQRPFMMTLEFLVDSTLTSILLSGDCWKYSGFIKEFRKPDMSIMK